MNQATFHTHVITHSARVKQRFLVFLYFYVIRSFQVCQRLLDAQGSQAGSRIGIPALFHQLRHDSESLNRLPPIRYRGPLPINAHHLAHFFDWRIRRYHIVEWLLVVFKNATNIATPSHLPENEPQSVDIGAFKCIKVIWIYRLVQYLNSSRTSVSISKRHCYKSRLTSGDIYRFVPTLWFKGISTASKVAS